MTAKCVDIMTVVYVSVSRVFTDGESNESSGSFSLLSFWETLGLCVFIIIFTFIGLTSLN